MTAEVMIATGRPHRITRGVEIVLTLTLVAQMTVLALRAAPWTAPAVHSATASVASLVGR